ncbi:MAG: hypothetical protein P4L78_21005 [Silvimonas sp.]|nr:hypothetical protein [Silvimonas sp.]MDR3429933.1 hypothetical protein [Silvimonas sp.]
MKKVQHYNDARCNNQHHGGDVDGSINLLPGSREQAAENQPGGKQ